MSQVSVNQNKLMFNINNFYPKNITKKSGLSISAFVPIKLLN